MTNEHINLTLGKYVSQIKISHETGQNFTIY